MADAQIRNWPAFIDELVRVTRPGGLVVSVEVSFPFKERDKTWEETKISAPGFAAFVETMQRCVDLPCGAAQSHRNKLIVVFSCPIRSITVRGLDAKAGSDAVPSLLRSHDLLRSVESVHGYLPWVVCGEGEPKCLSVSVMYVDQYLEPNWKQAG